MQMGYLYWVPPVGLSPRGCLIDLQGTGNGTIGTVTMHESGKQVLARINHLDPAPRRGVVMFPDGETSAPIPIADIDRLARNGNAALSPAEERLITQIGEMTEIDERALTLAMQVRSMVDSEQHKRAGRRTSSSPSTAKGPAEDDTTPMTTAGFLGTDHEREIERTDTSWRQSALAEAYRQFMIVLGLGLEVLQSDQEEDETDNIDAKDLAPQDEQDPEVPPQDQNQTQDSKQDKDDEQDRDEDQAQDENEDRESDDTTGGDNDSPKPPQKPQEPVQKPRAEIEEEITAHLTRIRSDVKNEPVDVLTLRNAYSLSMAILATLNRAAAVGHKPTRAKPMPAERSAGSIGWITLIGGLLAEIRDGLPRSHALNCALDGDRIECLAILLFAADRVNDAASKSRMSPGIKKTFADLHGDLARLIHVATADRPELQSHLEAMLDSLETKFSRASMRQAETA